MLCCTSIHPSNQVSFTTRLLRSAAEKHPSSRFSLLHPEKRMIPWTHHQSGIPPLIPETELDHRRKTSFRFVGSVSDTSICGDANKQRRQKDEEEEAATGRDEHLAHRTISTERSHGKKKKKKKTHSSSTLMSLSS